MKKRLVAALFLLGCASPRPATTATPTATPHLDASSRNGDRYVIDGHEVTKEAFASFEQSLTARREQIMCAETPTGGYSSYTATAPSGVRYTVKHLSVNDRTLDEAERDL